MSKTLQLYFGFIKYFFHKRFFYSIIGLTKKPYTKKEGVMTDYEKAVVLWQSREIKTDAELADIPDSKVLTAAYFHGKFENIHPFADGNGRTGRLAMNYFLVLHNHPPVIIHEEDKKAYYEALEAWDRDQELEPLLAFLRQQTIKTWEKWIRREEKRAGNFQELLEI